VPQLAKRLRPFFHLSGPAAAKSPEDSRAGLDEELANLNKKPNLLGRSAADELLSSLLQ
jgi:hypothetical protein